MAKSKPKNYTYDYQEGIGHENFPPASPKKCFSKYRVRKQAEKRRFQMIAKTYTKTKKSCKITFKINPGPGIRSVSVVGDFNNWNPGSHPLAKRKNGEFSGTVTLSANQTYRFRYFVNGEYWENDDAADGYIPNCFGTDDSQIII
jgi:1,4-alpha-glucan branching enzyme